MRNSVDVLLLHEPLLVGTRVSGVEVFLNGSVFCSERSSAGAAIVILYKSIKIVEVSHLMNRFLAIANMKKAVGKYITFVSAYFKYSIPTHFITTK